MVTSDTCSESDVDDHNFIKWSSESDRDPPPLKENDDDYQTGDSEFEESGDDNSDNSDDEDDNPKGRSTRDLKRVVEEATCQCGLAAARKETVCSVKRVTPSK